MPNLIVAAGMSVPGSGAAGWKRSAVSALAAALKASIAASASEPSVEDFRQVDRRMVWLLLRLRGARRGLGGFPVRASCVPDRPPQKTADSRRRWIDVARIFCILYAKWSVLCVPGGNGNRSEYTRR